MHVMVQQSLHGLSMISTSSSANAFSTMCRAVALASFKQLGCSWQFRTYSQFQFSIRTLTSKTIEYIV